MAIYFLIPWAFFLVHEEFLPMKKAKTFKPKVLGTGKKFSNKKPREYDTISWIEFRNKFLAANPKCYADKERATVVDHVVAHKEKKELFWNDHNYIPLCKKCHDFITGKFDRHNPPLTEEKMKWIEAKRLETGTAIKVRVVSIPKEKERRDDERRDD